MHCQLSNVLFKLVLFPCVWCLPQLGPWAASGALDWVNAPVNYELWESFGYNTLCSIIPGLAPSMSTALGLKVKIISHSTVDCRTWLSTLLSPGCESKLSIRVLRWVTCLVTHLRVRAAPPPTPWGSSWVLVPKGCRQWAARASLGPAWGKWIKHVTWRRWILGTD